MGRAKDTPVRTPRPERPSLQAPAKQRNKGTIGWTPEWRYPCTRCEGVPRKPRAMSTGGHRELCPNVMPGSVWPMAVLGHRAEKHGTECQVCILCHIVGCHQHLSHPLRQSPRLDFGLGSSVSMILLFSNLNMDKEDHMLYKGLEVNKYSQ